MCTLSGEEGIGKTKACKSRENHHDEQREKNNAESRPPLLKNEKEVSDLDVNGLEVKRLMRVCCVVGAGNRFLRNSAVIKFFRLLPWFLPHE
jgi:hypothetical protein